MMTNQKHNRLWQVAAMLLVAMAGLLPTTSWAQAAGEVLKSGDCGVDGSNLTYTLTYTGETYTSSGTEKPKLKLTISGSGAMADFKWVSGSGYTTPWYSERASIYYVDLQEGITVIGQYAIYQLPADNIVIPSTVQTIRSSAFWNCYRLNWVTIPASVTRIETRAFAACYAMMGYIVEAGNPLYDSRNDCNAIIETLSNRLICGGVRSTIPDGVQTIGTSAFSSLDQLRSIYIPNSVTTIEGGAFSDCGLVELNLPASVTRLESSSFNGCRFLKTITVDEGNPVYDSRNNCNALIETATNSLLVGSSSTVIPMGIKTIREGAFFSNQELESINIPSSVELIYNSAFAQCPRLTDVKCFASPTALNIFEPGQLFSSNPTFHVAPGTIEQWQSTWGVLPVNFVDDLTEEENTGGATETTTTTHFTSVDTYPQEVMTYGFLNSQDGKQWRYVHSGQGHVEAQMSTYGGERCVSMGFQNYKELLLFPTFPLKGKLLKVIVRVGGDLQSLNVYPKGPSDDTDRMGYSFTSPWPEAIYEHTFDYSDRGGVEIDPEHFGISFLKFADDYTVPLYIESVTIVMETGDGSSLSGSCGSDLKWKLTNSDEMVQIQEDGIWKDVPGLKLTISGTGPMTDYMPDASIGQVAPWKQYGDRIVEISIADGVTSIGMYAFMGLNSGSINSTLTIPASVTTIGTGAFQNSYFFDTYCYADVDNLVWEDVQSSFYNDCGFHVFEADEAKWKAKYPSVRFIFFFDLAQPGQLPGGKCGDNLRWQLVDLGTTHQIWWSGYDKPTVYQSRKVVFTGTGDMYNYSDRNRVPWSRQNQYNILEMQMPDGATSIGDNAFFGLLKLSKVSIPGSVRTIGKEAFYNCDLPSKFVLADGLEAIGEKAFCASSILNRIFIPASVTTVGAGALSAFRIDSIMVAPANPVYTSRDANGNECNILLEKATGLLVSATGISVLPSTVKTIGRSCYENSMTIKEVVIPSSVTTLEKEAFYYCSELVTLTIGSGVKFIGQNCFRSSTNILDVFCYANPNDLVWEEKSASYISEFKSDKMTQFHVFAADLETWKAKFSWVNVTFVGDLESPIMPVIVETDIAFDDLKGVDLTEPVAKDDVYYNLGNGGKYQEELGCIVLSKPTDMSDIANAEPGSSDIRDKYTGLIIRVGAGRGKITLDVATKGRSALMVQIGDGTPTPAVLGYRGDVVFTYNVTEDTYVYIYSVNTGAAARGAAADEENAVMIYGITVTPQPGIEGDINEDLNVDVGDIMGIINVMAGQPGAIKPDDADVNADGNVDVGDIMAIINIMSGKH